MSIFICAGAVTLQRIGLSPLDMVIPLHRSATTTYYVKVIFYENNAPKQIRSGHAHCTSRACSKQLHGTKSIYDLQFLIVKNDNKLLENLCGL